MKSSMGFVAALCVTLLSCTTGGSARNVIEKSWFDRIDGVFDKAEYIDLSPNGSERLYIRYGPISDSGVELERVENKRVVWRAHVQPLGISHSKYVHEVWVGIEKDAVIVNSFGAKQITELHDLTTGRLISRVVTDTR